LTPGPLSACLGVTCSYLATLGTTAADLTYTFDQLTNTMSFQTATTSKDGQTLTVSMIVVTPPSLLTPCGWTYSHMTLKLYNPSTVPSVISTITYNLGDPFVPVTVTAFTNNKGITGDPKLSINYVSFSQMVELILLGLRLSVSITQIG